LDHKEVICGKREGEVNENVLNNEIKQLERRNGERDKGQDKN
jgi:hypothetical protein